MPIKLIKKSVQKKILVNTKKSRRTKTICVSHKEDADGISSAALITGLHQLADPA